MVKAISICASSKNVPTGSGKYSTSGGLSGKTIIDPGHGGSDSGAIGPHGVQEKTLHYRFHVFEKSLENRGAKVLMTRTTDVDVYFLMQAVLMNWGSC